MYSTGGTDTRQNIKLISYDDYTRRVWSQETHMGKKKNCIREPRQNPGGETGARRVLGDPGQPPDLSVIPSSPSSPPRRGIVENPS